MKVISVSAGWFGVFPVSAFTPGLICQYGNVLYQFVNEAINLSMSQYANVRIQYANVLICQCANESY